jgi:hypothetical protein
MSENDKIEILPPAVEAMDDDMAEMERVAAAAGRKGNIYAIDVSHRLRARRQRIVLDLPALDTLDGVEKAQVAVIAAAASGRIAPRDAIDLSALIENRRRALASRALEERLRALEKINAERAEAARAQGRKP